MWRDVLPPTLCARLRVDCIKQIYEAGTRQINPARTIHNCLIKYGIELLTARNKQPVQFVYGRIVDVPGLSSRGVWSSLPYTLLAFWLDPCGKRSGAPIVAHSGKAACIGTRSVVPAESAIECIAGDAIVLCPHTPFAVSENLFADLRICVTLALQRIQ